MGQDILLQNTLDEKRRKSIMNIFSIGRSHDYCNDFMYVDFYGTTNNRLFALESKTKAIDDDMTQARVLVRKWAFCMLQDLFALWPEQ
ncbi:unnamed protein product [Clonostachys rosea f. rosea IK726]|uniref:Uncharacterized protein n=1 Tax=Clonostachys rosea f. rosea IK726 TaxID=1349383 RepID=A0ACA9T5X8_BIOOC|nr:unnamed protein product [Clonostachys rosea f. rosea IK726]